MTKVSLKSQYPVQASRINFSSIPFNSSNVAATSPCSSFKHDFSHVYYLDTGLWTCLFPFSRQTGMGRRERDGPRAPPMRK
jgi:hypothetical protein